MSRYKAYNYCKQINCDNIKTALTAIEKFCRDNIANPKYKYVIELFKQYGMYEHSNYYISHEELINESTDVEVNNVTEAEANKYRNIIDSLLCVYRYRISNDIDFYKSCTDDNNNFLALLGYVIDKHSLSFEYILETILYYETYEAVKNRTKYIYYLTAITYCTNINVIQPRNLQSEYNKAIFSKDNIIHNVMKETINTIPDYKERAINFITFRQLRADAIYYVESAISEYVYNNNLNLNINHLDIIYKN